MVRCYLAPHNASTLDSVVAAIGHMPRSAERLIVCDLNTYLESTDGNECDEAIAAEMEMEGLKDMTEKFLPRNIPWKRDGRTWKMLCRG